MLVSKVLSRVSRSSGLRSSLSSVALPNRNQVPIVSSRFYSLVHGTPNKAVRTALKKLEEGGNIEDAKAVCEPEVLSQILKWKDNLSVYLAPFLHGARYTSFGRHFTNPEKLQQIVDKLHWYAEDGDMIVDFCCGSNDFSCLMKAKLEETGKKCLYKNYDLLPPKKNFNFERRDWMTITKDELEPDYGAKSAIWIQWFSCKQVYL